MLPVTSPQVMYITGAFNDLQKVVLVHLLSLLMLIILYLIATCIMNISRFGAYLFLNIHPTSSIYYCRCL
jgi:hypothetical protein